MAITIIKNSLKKGVSYRLMSRLKNPYTNEIIIRSTTWKKPDDMTDAEAKHYLQKFSYDFEESILNELKGKGIKNTDITLIQYSLDRNERMKSAISPHTYSTSKNLIEEMRSYFGDVKLKDVTPALIQDFLDKKQRQGIIIQKFKVKGNLKDRLKSKRMKVNNFVKRAGISKITYEKTNNGELVSKITAQRICKALNCKIRDCFEIETTKKPFARATINRYRKLLCASLASAKRQCLVAHNYASRDYIESPAGTKKDIVILNEVESIKLANELEKECNIIIKTALMTSLYMGIRRSELAGLQWQDIDLDNNMMKIQRSMHYDKSIGLYYRCTKTESSTREISIPDHLAKQLKIYFEWWKEHRPYYIDPKFEFALFKNDSLMPYSPGVYLTWLRKILLRANLTQVNLHSLRHTNISLQMMAGIDKKTIAGRVGHSQTSTTTDIYSHFLRSGDQNACNIIDKIFED